jgi:hypothetical protein
MSISNIYTAGLNHVGAYQVSGRPFIQQLSLTTNADESQRVQFDKVTKNIIVRTTSSHAVRIHFAPFTASAAFPDYTHDASSGNNFVTLSGSGQISLDVKCKEIFISAPLGAVTDVVEVYAELTTIPAERMFSLDGVVGVSS